MASSQPLLLPGMTSPPGPTSSLVFVIDQKAFSLKIKVLLLATNPSRKPKKSWDSQGINIHLSSLQFFFFFLKTVTTGTSLVVQWLRLHAPNAGRPGSIPGQGTRSHMLQLRVCVPQIKMLRATAKTWHSQINKNKYF